MDLLKIPLPYNKAAILNKASANLNDMEIAALAGLE
jgi:hypothetical protein